MEFKGSKTEANLHTAFAGESEARNKYTYYAGIAKKEGYNQIASIFEETAGNEKEHAKIWFKILMSGGIPHASLPDTMANLKDAAEYSNVKKNRFGSAATVAELLLLKKLRKNARSATIRRAILN